MEQNIDELVERIRNGTVNLSNDLRGANLVGANLSGLNLDGANFDNAILTEADFTNSSLIRASFINSDMRNATASNTNFTSSNFSFANLTSCVFQNCVFLNCLFINTDIHNSFIVNSNFTNAMFTGANLSNINLSSNIFSQGGFYQANLQGTIFPTGFEPDTRPRIEPINIDLTRISSINSNGSTPRTIIQDTPASVNTPGTVLYREPTPLTRMATPVTPQNLVRQNAIMGPPPVTRRPRQRTFDNIEPLINTLPRNADEERMNLDWLDEEFTVQPARRRRLNEPVLPPRQGRLGVAFEIHEYSGNIMKPQIVEFYNRVTEIPRTNYNNETVKDYFKNKMIELINQNPRYTEAEKQKKRSDLNYIFSSRLEGHETYNPIETLLMGYSIDYAFLQDPIFQQLYIDTYLTDCTEAYATGPALSCAAGTYERSYTSIAKAIQQRLLEPNVDGFNLTDAKKNEYNNLFVLFEGVPDEFLFPVAREWLEQPNMPGGLEERKNSLREYIIRRVREQFNYQVQPGDAAYRKIEQKIINDPYVVSELEKETPEFGGSRRKRQTRKIRKGRKTNTKKRRKTKKIRRTKITRKIRKRR